MSQQSQFHPRPQARASPTRIRSRAWPANRGAASREDADAAGQRTGAAARARPGSRAAAAHRQAPRVRDELPPQLPRASARTRAANNLRPPPCGPARTMSAGGSGTACRPSFLNRASAPRANRWAGCCATRPSGTTLRASRRSSGREARSLRAASGWLRRRTRSPESCGPTASGSAGPVRGPGPDPLGACASATNWMRAASPSRRPCSSSTRPTTPVSGGWSAPPYPAGRGRVRADDPAHADASSTPSSGATAPST